MKYLIEFKLHSGHFPYFVCDVIGGVDVDGKRYGISQDTKNCYLPNTVRILSEDEFIEEVKLAKVYKPTLDDSGDILMTEYEKENFCREWLNLNKYA